MNKLVYIPPHGDRTGAVRLPQDVTHTTMAPYDLRRAALRLPWGGRGTYRNYLGYSKIIKTPSAAARHAQAQHTPDVGSPWNISTACLLLRRT